MACLDNPELVIQTESQALHRLFAGTPQERQALQHLQRIAEAAERSEDRAERAEARLRTRPSFWRRTLTLQISLRPA